MGIPEIVEIWIRSLHSVFESIGVEVLYVRSPPERINSSFALNLRRGPVEADLLVWESGHADLSTMASNGSISQKHFEDLRNVKAIAEVLAVLGELLHAPKHN